jgi:5S rRNA maturation endonuclease (ribonuclease M5)
MAITRYKDSQSFADSERAERLREILEELDEVNREIPVVVEGKKDASALRSLGLSGEIITLHNGQNIYDFCETLTRRHRQIVLLLDWDRKGEELTRLLSSHLAGHWEEFSTFRDILKILCQKEIKDIEGIPSLLKRLEGNETAWC